MTADTRRRGAIHSRLLDTDPGDWRTAAACAGEDPEIWFPATRPGHRWADPSPTYQRQAQLAKDVCDACPVVDDCLQWAPDTGQDHGIWGGLDEYERRHLARGTGQIRPPASPACGSLAAARQHRYRHQPLDDACRMAEALYRAQLASRKETACTP